MFLAGVVPVAFVLFSWVSAGTEPGEDPGACCLPDNDRCAYIAAGECERQGGVHLGPETDCSVGFCCPGPCCLPDGTCERQTFYDCVYEGGGVWWSSMLTCDQVDCEPPRACCVDSIGCLDVPVMTCMQTLGGTPQAYGSTCNPDPCPPFSPRACCLPDASCWDMTHVGDLAECVLQDGMPGVDSCMMSFCLPTEACCIDTPDGKVCLNQMSLVCEFSGGTPGGMGTKCSTNTTCGAGACCLPDGSCEVTSALACGPQGGHFISGEQFCGGPTCDPQACCKGDDPCAGGTCTEVPIGFCVETGGSPLGPGSVCAAWPCGPGACCLPDGTCEQLSGIECLEKGGESEGSGTECSDVRCRPFRAGACCISATECVITRLESVCTLDLGGQFLGFDTGCPTQEIKYFSEPGGDVCNHAIVTVVDCPDPGVVAGTSCPAEPGPKLDTWISREDASMCHTFGVTDSPLIPAGFFGPESEPFGGSMCLRGVPLGVVQLDDLGEVDAGDADTLVRRQADPFDRCALPSETPVPVEIEMAALSLESVAPIRVSYDQGSSFESWSGTVDLSAVYSDADSSNDPPLGALSATRTHCNGGTYTSVLYVQPRFTFVNDDNPKETRVLDLGLEGVAPIMLDASALPIDFVIDVHPSLGALSLVCTDFHPGLGEDEPAPVCDCNGNQTRDKCDIESGFSLDCNLTQTPDLCDITDGTSQDCNTNTIPDECDIASELSLDCNDTRIPDECETITLFDFDGNGRVDAKDHYGFTLSMAGPGEIPTAPTLCLSAVRDTFDSDTDSDLDLADFAAFQQAMTFGP